MWSKIPFNIVLFATTLPWIAAFFDSKWITYTPFILSLLIYFLFETRKHSKIMAISYGFMITFFVILISMFWQSIHGIGIGSMGTIIIFLLTFIFFKFFLSNQYGNISQHIIKQIQFIYAFHVIFILSELVFRIAGGTDIIVSLVGETTNVARYKMYNKAVFLHFLGFDKMTGLGGLLLGSQSASQVALFSVFIFAPFYKNNALYQNNKHAFKWFLLSVVAFLVSITMTASLIATILLLLIFFYLPNSKYKSFKYQFALIAVSSVLFFPIIQKIFINISNARDFNIYFSTFYSSIDTFMQFDYTTQFFGYGRSAKYLTISDPVVGGSRAEFGLGMLFTQSGILLIGFGCFILIKIFFQVQHMIKNYINISFINTPWVWIASVNSLIALGWGLSLIHYTPAVELGGRELFAFHVAVSIFSMKEMKYQIYLFKSHV